MKNLLFSPAVWMSRSAGVLILRLALGLVFFMHGAQKTLGWFGGSGLEGTIGFMNSLGISTFLAYVVSFWELFGGIFIILGFLTRLWSAGLVVNMLVAIFAVHIGAGFFASAGGFEFNLTLLAIALSLIFLGSGKFSVDHSIHSRPASPPPVVH